MSRVIKFFVWRLERSAGVKGNKFSKSSYTNTRGEDQVNARGKLTLVLCGSVTISLKGGIWVAFLTFIFLPSLTCLGVYKEKDQDINMKTEEGVWVVLRDTMVEECWFISLCSGSCSRLGIPGTYRTSRPDSVQPILQFLLSMPDR